MANNRKLTSGAAGEPCGARSAAHGEQSGPHRVRHGSADRPGIGPARPASQPGQLGPASSAQLVAARLGQPARPVDAPGPAPAVPVRQPARFGCAPGLLLGSSVGCDSQVASQPGSGEEPGPSRVERIGTARTASPAAQPGPARPARRDPSQHGQRGTPGHAVRSWRWRIEPARGAGRPSSHRLLIVAEAIDGEAMRGIACFVSCWAVSPASWLRCYHLAGRCWFLYHRCPWEVHGYALPISEG
jgi:hypothetical protein